MTILPLVFALLFAFQIKHLVADYLLQGYPLANFMLGKFRPGPDFVGPLAAHCAVHAALTGILAIATGAGFSLISGVVVLDFTAHFVMDRLKAGPKYLGRFKAFRGTADEYVQMSRRTAVYERTLELKRPPEKMYEDAYRAMWNNTLFWWSLGLDQCVHHGTNYLIIYLLLTRT